MKITRRNFVKLGLTGVAAASIPLISFEILSPAEVKSTLEKNKRRWGFLVNTLKCVGCGFCVKACKLENEVKYNASVSRTWVERYIILKENAVSYYHDRKITFEDHSILIDSPNAGRDGFTTNKVRGVEIKEEDIEKAFFVPKLCNHCDNPPCIQVCPVGATYQTEEGIVLVDRSWCIGCGYCIMACPYGARFFHTEYRVAEKCTFCIHRLSKGLKPACVEACAFGARTIGNLKDPDDPVTKTVTTQRVGVLRDEYGTNPQCFYLGLDKQVR